MTIKLGIRQIAEIDKLVEFYKENQQPLNIALDSIQGYINNSKSLSELIHSVKFRLKDPEHLKDKLIRKAIDAKKAGRQFSITEKNLFSRINDLAGYRIIHLHTRQFQDIDRELKRIFDEQQWIITEGPSAKTWDDESRSFFTEIGVQVSNSPNLYTSVHYIVKPNSKTKVTCEIQVRTLMEEVWGEVDHSINYPHKSEIYSIREQIKVLARVTSSCSRLVDSIFSTNHEAISELPKKGK